MDINILKKGAKIFGVVFLLAVIFLITYLSINVEYEQGYKISVIEISGNSHLSTDIYYKFANLNDRNAYNMLSVQIIKDRIEKHPYVEKADVRYEGEGKVTVNIFEKSFQSVLFTNDERYIITEEMEVLPVFPFTKNINYPVISNPNIDGKITLMSSLKRNKEIVRAFKIISTLELANPELYDNLSEIDLRSREKVVLFFSLIGYPVWVDRDNEVKKMICFTNLWNLLRGQEVNKYLDYIDLRFENHVYLGFSNERLEEKEIRS